MGAHREEVEEIIKRFLGLHGLKGPNFEGTPERVARFWDEFLYPSEPLVKTFPLKTKQGAIVLKDIALWGFCPHHLLPIEYTFKVGYIPQTNPLGASKPVRIIRQVLAKLPLQEELPQMVVERIQQEIEIKGAGCIVEGRHLCMQMRGIMQSRAIMVTDYLTGCFLDQPETRQEFMLL